MTIYLSCKRHVKDHLYDIYKHYTKWVLQSSDPPTGVRNAAISVRLFLSWFTSGSVSPTMDKINNNVCICETTCVLQTVVSLANSFSASQKKKKLKHGLSLGETNSLDLRSPFLEPNLIRTAKKYMHFLNL